MMRIALLLFAAFAGAGCHAVKPWERELLAQPGMSFESTVDSEVDQHMLEAREASAGGYGASGGGCGCN
jgi:hypothetical protein